MPRYRFTRISKEDISSRYAKRKGNIRKYDTTMYEKNEEQHSDIFVVTQEGDRLDNLAAQFYGDSRLWWFIANVNKLKTLNVEAGTSLRLPSATDSAKEKINKE